MILKLFGSCQHGFWFHDPPPVNKIKIIMVVPLLIAASPAISCRIFVIVLPRYDKVLAIDRLLCRLAAKTDAIESYLGQEMVKWADQILNEVKIIVIHVDRHYNRARCFTFIVQSKRMFIRDEVVL